MWTPAQRKYAMSSKGKIARKKYQSSEKAKLARARYLANRKAKKLELGQAQTVKPSEPQAEQESLKPVSKEVKSKE